MNTLQMAIIGMWHKQLYSPKFLIRPVCVLRKVSLTERKSSNAVKVNYVLISRGKYPIFTRDTLTVVSMQRVVAK